MQIDLPDQTIRDVEAMLARQGLSVDVPAFVDRTLQRALFFETVREVKRQNTGVDASLPQVKIDEAVSSTGAQ